MQLEAAEQELERSKQQLRDLEQKHAGEVPVTGLELKKLREQASGLNPEPPTSLRWSPLTFLNPGLPCTRAGACRPVL